MDSVGGYYVPVGDFDAHEELREKHAFSPALCGLLASVYCVQLVPAWDRQFCISLSNPMFSDPMQLA